MEAKKIVIKLLKEDKITQEEFIELYDSIQVNQVPIYPQIYPVPYDPPYYIYPNEITSKGDIITYN